MGGCGTHLTLDLLEKAGYSLTDLLAPLINVLALGGGKKEIGLTCDKFGIAAPSALDNEAALFDCLDRAIEALPGDRLAVVNEFEFQESVLDFIEKAREKIGADIILSAFVRHPVDIFLSRRERSGEELNQQIQQFYSVIFGTRFSAGLGVARYEDLCSGYEDKILETLHQMRFAEDDIEKLDISMIHGGSLAKWRLYPKVEVEALAGEFGTIMEQMNYDCDAPGMLGGIFLRLGQRINNYRAEIQVLNKVASGDFSVDGAYSRHHRSLLGRIWFRIKLMSGKNREAFTEFYRTRKDSELPARPIKVLIRNLLTGRGLR